MKTSFAVLVLLGLAQAADPAAGADAAKPGKDLVHEGETIDEHAVEKPAAKKTGDLVHEGETKDGHGEEL